MQNEAFSLKITLRPNDFTAGTWQTKTMGILGSHQELVVSIGPQVLHYVRFTGDVMSGHNPSTLEIAAVVFH